MREFFSIIKSLNYFDLFVCRIITINNNFPNLFDIFFLTFAFFLFDFINRWNSFVSENMLVNVSICNISSFFHSSIFKILKHFIKSNDDISKNVFDKNHWYLWYCCAKFINRLHVLESMLFFMWNSPLIIKLNFTLFLW